MKKEMKERAAKLAMLERLRAVVEFHSFVDKDGHDVVRCSAILRALELATANCEGQDFFSTFGELFLKPSEKQRVRDEKNSPSVEGKR